MSAAGSNAGLDGNGGSNPSVARDALGVKLGHRRVRNHYVARLAVGNPSVNTSHDRNYKDESPTLEV